MKSRAGGFRKRAPVGFSLLLAASVVGQAGCGGRYELGDSSAGGSGPQTTNAGTPVAVHAGAPSIAEPGRAGGPSNGGAFAAAGAVGVAVGGYSEPCRADRGCDVGLACAPNGLCLPDQGVGGGELITPSKPSVCDGLGTRILDARSAKLDDFEQPMISSGWSAFADLGPPGVDASDNSLSLVRVSPGATFTAGAGRYQGMGGNPAAKPPGFGVGVILNVALDPPSGSYCADISAFDGISFWAKSGVSDTVFYVNFVLPATNQMSLDPNIAGGDCISNCYNHPRKAVALSGTWERYSVRFADAGGGSEPVQNLIQEIGWFSPDSTWDFSLDEIAFYKGTPPPGALGPSGIK